MATLTKKGEREIGELPNRPGIEKLVSTIFWLSVACALIIQFVFSNFFLTAIPLIVGLITASITAKIRSDREKRIEAIKEQNSPFLSMGCHIDTATKNYLRDLSIEDREDEIEAIKKDASEYLDGDELETYMTQVRNLYENPRTGQLLPLPPGAEDYEGEQN